MATTTVDTTATPATARTIRTIGLIAVLAGAILIIAGVVTWFVVRAELQEENITVSDDAEMLAGDEVDGPFSAYAEAQVIQKHALEATDGQTYAELPQDSELRQTAMTASFLRASLFTSVVAFGVAAMAAGIGVVLILLGYGMMKLSRQVAAAGAVPVAAAPAARAEPVEKREESTDIAP
jgi:hypothetical protein